LPILTNFPCVSILRQTVALSLFTEDMGGLETLYGTCTGLGTAILVLIFVNYYLEAESEPETTATQSAGKAKRKRE
jgi:hypothetical protein